MNVNISVGAMQEYALTRLANDANAARPLDSGGQPIGAALTAETYLQARVADAMADYCRVHCRISIASGIDRLTAAEFGRIKSARAASPAVDAAVRPIFDSRTVELAGPLWVNGIHALAGAGLLDQPTATRVAALTAPPQPGETLA